MPKKDISKKFFEERSEQSSVKTQIVTKYFDVWSNIIIDTVKKTGDGKIGYIDLFAGPGQYKDHTPSTPVLILKAAIKNGRIRGSLETLFADADENNISTLEEVISKLSRVNTLGHYPEIIVNEVGKDKKDIFSNRDRIPSLTFLDPFGYKGLSLRLFSEAVKDWGCECIFFFNYQRINAAITNPTVESYIDDIFGKERANKLRKKVEGVKAGPRREIVLDELTDALRETVKGVFVLPFAFRDKDRRLTHHLIFVSKNFKGYEEMKKIMAKASSQLIEQECIASFTFSLAPKLKANLPGLGLLDKLKELLLKEFSGRTLETSVIYRTHNVGTPYILNDYKVALMQLEEEGKISVTDPEGKNRRKGSFPSRLMVAFDGGD